LLLCQVRRGPRPAVCRGRGRGAPALRAGIPAGARLPAAVRAAPAGPGVDGPVSPDRRAGGGGGRGGGGLTYGARVGARVERDGGRVLALYQEPVGEHWQIFCLLPRGKCEASPYQRDLSPTHVKRLTESIKRLDRFVDPIVVISPPPARLWTPNGNHRRTVLDKLKADFIPAILVVEPQMVFEVLPLN